MKVPASIRRIYDDQRSLNARLKESVDARMAALKDARWHYESRIKELQSFALKVESGRFDEPSSMEDLFACTLVVSNSTQIQLATTLVEEQFAVVARRPPKADKTHKAANSFPFDDLRLYAKLRSGPEVPVSDQQKLVFEVQVKTFLQHAWSIATHDLVYKTDDANWSKERIAFQIKAMLEHAEVSILEAERLAQSTALAKEDRNTTGIREAIQVVKTHWGADQLPLDVRRLAENVRRLAEVLDLDLTRIESVLTTGKAKRAGAHPANLSPYSVLIQYLFDQEPERMLKALSEKDSRRKIFVPDEVELPNGVNRANLVNAIFA